MITSTGNQWIKLRNGNYLLKKKLVDFLRQEFNLTSEYELRAYVIGTQINKLKEKQ